MGDAFEQAKALHNDGKLDEAVNTYRQLLETDPDNFKAHNNLGIVYEEREDYATAVESYRRALEIKPDAAPVQYNLGHALQRQGQLGAAIAAYNDALASGEDDADTFYNIGSAYHDLGDLAAAETAYRKAIELNSELYRAHSNLGSVLFDRSRLPEAASHYKRAIEIKADSAADHFNLGRVWEVEGKLAEAAQAFRESLGLNPLSAAAYEHLAMIENKLNRPQQAAEVFEQWLFLMPDNPVALHLLASSTGDQGMARASEGYVRETFDSFAAEFDRRLQSLNYSAPEVIGRCVAELLDAPERNLNVLDIGCGTGLCARHLRRYAKQLTGVDLSGAMLEKARERGGYDELVEAELANFMAAHPDSYDLIISADVLIYFGDLRPVFDSAVKSLRDDGRFVFTLEHIDDEEADLGYFLNQHGRYSHTEAYLRRAAEQAGLAIIKVSLEALRLEEGKPVNEFVVVAKKMAAET